MAVGPVIGGLGLARGVAGTAQAAWPGAWGFALTQTPSGAAVAGHWAERVPSPRRRPARKPGPGNCQAPLVSASRTGGARDRGDRSVRLVPGAETGLSSGTEPSSCRA